MLVGVYVPYGTGFESPRSHGPILGPQRGPTGAYTVLSSWERCVVEAVSRERGELRQFSIMVTWSLKWTCLSFTGVGIVLKHHGLTGSLGVGGGDTRVKGGETSVAAAAAACAAAVARVKGHVAAPGLC